MAEKHTTVTFAITPVALWALVHATRDTDTGDEAVHRLASALERAGHLTLAGAIQDHVSQRAEERAYREETEQINAAEWSENQRKFILEARAMGHRVHLYSGRGMYGSECPAVSGDDVDPDDFEAGVCHDSLGLGLVVYARG